MIGIFGSCVSRDLFEHPALRPLLGPYAARSSVISAVAPPVPIRDEAVILPSAWQRRCLLADFHKTHFGQLAAGRPQWVVIDLIDERFDLLRVGGSYVTRSSAFDAAGLGDAAEFEFELVRRMSAEGCDLFQRSVPGFAERILELVPAHRVVLHRALWCTRYRKDGEVHGFAERKLDLCYRQNAMLNRGYDALAEAFAGRAATIEVDPERHLADAGHRWQLEPFHYDAAYNDGAIGCLRDIVRAAEAA